MARLEQTTAIKKMAKFLKQILFGLQATMPSDEKHPSRVPMWMGVKVAYTIVAMCLFPLAIGGYWAYGQMVQKLFHLSFDLSAAN